MHGVTEPEHDQQNEHSQGQGDVAENEPRLGQPVATLAGSTDLAQRPMSEDHADDRNRAQAAERQDPAGERGNRGRIGPPRS